MTCNTINRAVWWILLIAEKKGAEIEKFEYIHFNFFQKPFAHKGIFDMLCFEKERATNINRKHASYFRGLSCIIYEIIITMNVSQMTYLYKPVFARTRKWTETSHLRMLLTFIF